MEKKTKQNVVRVSNELFELGREMAARRGAKNFSEYVRGLILLDAADISPDLVFGHDLPGWTTRDKRFEEAISRMRNGSVKPGREDAQS
ncbi:MAG TPA: hypothetical protein VKM93_09195 [Terriglobia bacterium]|nr:hypothetical protein [Terriglobia bacterium]